MELDCLWGMMPTFLQRGLTEVRRRIRCMGGGSSSAGANIGLRRSRALASMCGKLALGAVALGLAAPAWGAAENGGLGLLPIGDQYPIKLRYLTFAPEPVLALPEGTFQLDYQFSVANTIVNTQYKPRNGTPTIAQAQVDAGLTAANFPTTGFGAYLDMETDRNLIRFRWGVGDGVELGLDQGWVSFGGGGLDSAISGVESVFNGENPERKGVANNQFHYYLYHNGHALIATSSPVDNVPQDPVVSMKWNLTPGGEVMPAVSVRLAYKAPLDSAKSVSRSLVSSGHDDFGYSVMFSKAVGRVVAHLQLGESLLSGVGNDYVPSMRHQFFGLEYRSSSTSSWIIQTSSQVTILNVGNVSGNSTDFQISRPADVASLGYKWAGKTFHGDLGFSEDYNSRDNTTDIVLFFDLGWKW